MGCNGGPNDTSGQCDITDGLGTVQAEPWLLLSLSATPNAIPTSGSSALLASLNTNSDQVDTSTAGSILNGPPATFQTTIGSVTPISKTIFAGTAASSFTGSASDAYANLCVTVDHENTCQAMIIGSPNPVISGTVFRDYDANGVQDPHELGVSGITVVGYDELGTVETTTTADDGSYQLGLLTGSNARLEFTGWPGYLYKGVQGADSRTTERFVDLSSGSVTDIDLAVQNPAQHCQSTPDVGIACYAHGDPLLGGDPASTDVFITFPYTRTGIKQQGAGLNPSYQFPSSLATGVDIGSIWGATYQRTSDTVFVSAHLKRHSGFGSLGTGGIYTLTSAGIPSPFVDLQSLGINTGTRSPYWFAGKWQPQSRCRSL